VKDLVEGKTETVNGVEQPVTNKPLWINAGTFAANATGTLLGVRNTTRAFDMNRVILTGSLDKTNANRVQLKVTYATKK